MKYVQLRYIASLVTGSTPPGSVGEEAYQTDGLDWIRPNDISDTGTPSISSKRLSTIGSTHSRIITQPACVIVGIGSVGKLGFALPPFATNQQIISVIPRPGWDMKYLYYVLKNSEQWIKANANGTTLPIINTNDLGRLPVPIRLFDEQKKIADKLDRELAEIDKFIADQQRLQDLLQERLVSLTFDLATDASNPDRYETEHPFWKTLPKGWTLQKLGWHFKIGNGSTPLSTNENYWTEDDTHIPWFNSSSVNQKLAVTPYRYVTDLAVKECHLPIVPKGSLLMGMIGQGKTRGQVTKTGIESTLSQNIAYLTPINNSKINVDFTRLALEAAYPELREINSGNGTTKGSLTCEDIQQFKIPVPELSQQHSILTKFVKNQSSMHDLLESSDALILMTEMKSALIDMVISGANDD